MPPDLLLALLGFAFVSSITPGPNNLLVLTSGLNHGVARSMPLIGGISLGFAAMLVVVGLGLGSLLRANSTLQTAAQVASVAYMLWLAWKVARSEPAAGDDQGRAPAQQPLSALAGATFQWINPKAWAIALTVTAAYISPENSGAHLTLVAAVFVIVALASLTAWAVFGQGMRRLVDSRAKLRIFNGVMALLLVASAAPVAYDLAQQLQERIV